VGEYASAGDGCQPIPGEAISHQFPDNSTEPGGEILGMCRSWTLGNTESLWVNAVELQQGEASHHSNWTFVPDTQFDGPDGVWPCSDRDYSQLVAAVAGGVLYAQSTQATYEVQKFPDGVVVRIPPGSRIISDIHTLNTTNEVVAGNMVITLYSIPESDVEVSLAPFHLTYDELAIPPQSTSRFTGECDLRASFGGDSLDMQVYYVLPHTHAMGSRFFLEQLGGPQDGESLIDVHGFNGEARGRRYDPPIDVGQADGLRFGCEFENPRDETVGWGFGDQEMCETLGFAASPIAFESRVSEVIADGADGSVSKFTGDCSTVQFSWAGK